MQTQTLSAFIAIVAMLVLCLPPLFAVRMLRRRLRSAQFKHIRLYRWALIGTVFALMFNLAVAVMVPPDFTSGLRGNNFEAVHIIGLFFSWICFWGCVALMTLFRSRRPSTPDPV